MKPIKLYSHALGPNPWKVVFVLNELGLPYESEYVDFSRIKKEPYTNVNPNGRVPAIEDPNTGITLWESGVILEYLASEYDKDHKISYDSKKDDFLTKQWLYFQVSGQGPYFGQYGWFKRFHAEQVPSAIERYEKEAQRVVSVIDAHLAKAGTDFLVGDKCTYADLAFIPWSNSIVAMGVDLNEGGKNSHYQAWMDRMLARDSVKKALAEREEAIQASKK